MIGLHPKFKFRCVEGKKTVVRTVSVMPLTSAAVVHVVEKMQGVPNFLYSDDPYRVFFQPMTDCWLVDDVGLLIACNIVRGQSAHVHMTFWDRRLRGRETIVSSMARRTIRQYDLMDLWTAIPVEHRRVIAFSKRCGFSEVYRDDSLVILKFYRR